MSIPFWEETGVFVFSCGCSGSKDWGTVDGKIGVYTFVEEYCPKHSPAVRPMAFSKSDVDFLQSIGIEP